MSRPLALAPSSPPRPSPARAALSIALAERRLAEVRLCSALACTNLPCGQGRALENAPASCELTCRHLSLRRAGLLG